MKFNTIIQLVVIFYCIVCSISLADVSGNVLYSFDSSVQNNRQIPRSSHQSLSLEGQNNTIKVVFANDKGEFKFVNIPDGKYILSVNDDLYDYESIFLEVSEDGSEVKAFQNNIKSGKGFKLKYPLQIRPLSKIIYVEESPNVIFSLLKSPYMIIIGLTVLMFLCMQMVPQDQLQDQFKEMNKTMHQYQKGNIFNK